MIDDSFESNSEAYAMIAESLAKMKAERKKRGIKIKRAIRIFLKDS
jgi:hypothetical protein